MAYQRHIKAGKQGGAIESVLMMYQKNQPLDGLEPGTVLRAPESWVTVTNDDGSQGIRDMAWLIHQREVKPEDATSIAGAKMVLLETPEKHEPWIGGNIGPCFLFAAAIVEEDARFVRLDHLRVKFNTGPQVYRNTVKVPPAIVRDHNGLVARMDFGFQVDM